MEKTSSLYNARLLAQLLPKHHCRNLVVAPGSRNAPLIMALTDLKEIETYSVPDERAAAFTALGMALEKGEPAAVLCTSGSAAANFLPAVTEAYYQGVPLIVITADRPQEWIGQGMGQTIQQEGLFGKHILAEANLYRQPSDELGEAYNLREVNRVLMEAHKGPVHINVPFEEPLYDQVDASKEDFRAFHNLSVTKDLSPQSWHQLVDELKTFNKVMLLAGQMLPHSDLDQALAPLLAKWPFLLFHESLSNINELRGVRNIDRLVNSLSETAKEELRPELLITFGGEVVSKMVKRFLQEFPPREHWHINSDGAVKDPFFRLTKVIELEPSLFFDRLNQNLESWPNADFNWLDQHLQKHQQIRVLHNQFLEEVPFSDLKAFELILNALPAGTSFHTANSASVRYAQLFDLKPGLKHYANRGTSGIDGCTSTAIGHATQIETPVTLVSGDVAFLYDNAAFWNDRLPNNLKIIVLNNQGGNIVRIIKGPQNIPEFERFQETKHKYDLKPLAELYQLDYTLVDNLESLNDELKQFFLKDKISLLEIKTSGELSPKVLNQYWRSLKI
jgi:2-succinyl-5-enolpyruvyl-6-hydroxy-3-cyclohexene-1-carboxylate synthase